MDVGNISGWYPELVGRRQTEDNADMAIFQVERFKQLPSHPDEVWQGDLIRTPAWVTGEGKPYRALMPLWVAVKDDRVFPGAICKPHERNLGMAVEALVNFACDDAVGGYRPGRIEVRDAALAEHLDGLFGDADITISHVEELDALDRIKLDMARHMLGKEPSPSPLDGEGVTLERMHAFAEAAAAFYRAAPWQYLTNIDLLEIEKPDAPAGMSFATVLGAGGAMFGLGLYDTAQDSYRIGEDTMSDEMESEIRHRMWQMSFGPITDLPTYDPDLWEDHDLPVVGDEAYPYAWSIRPSSANGISGDTTSGDMTSGGGGSGGRQIKRPNAGELSYLEGILRAMAETTEQEIDTGRWRKKVQTFDGPIKFTLALPGLLDPPQHDELAQHGVMPDRRAMERMSAQMQRYFDEHPAKDMDEAKAMIQQQFVGKGPNDIDCPPRTPLEEAQELCYQAFETRGRRCVQLARQALEICSDCADACVILAEYAAGAETKLEFYTQGIAAGERALGQETFKNDVGHFWGILQTRPYMRSRLGLAQTLEQLGRLDEAVAHYSELLRLNPLDNQSVRYLLLPRLLELGRDSEAARFMKESQDEPSANWTYTRALLAYRLGGDSAMARKELHKAVKVNPFVIDCLSDDSETRRIPDSYSPGSPEEAVICTEELRPAVTATPGALEWLQAQGRTSLPQRNPRQRKHRKRKSR